MNISPSYHKGFHLTNQNGIFVLYEINDAINHHLSSSHIIFVTNEISDIFRNHCTTVSSISNVVCGWWSVNGFMTYFVQLTIVVGFQSNILDSQALMLGIQ